MRSKDYWDCSVTKKLTLEQMKEFAKSKNGECLSSVYIKAGDKLLWRCHKKHEWKTSWVAVYSGHWCPHCAGQSKPTLKEIQKLAENRGGKLLSKEYINSKIKLLWECKEKHQWLSLIGNIKGGHWCPYCAGQGRPTIEEIQDLAQRRGGQLLSTEYKNAGSHLLWKCSQSHEWKACYDSIKHGTWCPTCNKSFSEEVCRLYFETIFNEKFPTCNPEWLKNEDGHPLELDGFCEKLNIAFEHNGLQHYEKIFLNTKDSVFERIKYNDSQKLKLCQQNNVKLIVIPALNIKTRIENLLDFIIKQCQDNNIKVPEIKHKINIDDVYNFKQPRKRAGIKSPKNPKIYDDRRLSISDMQNMAELRGGVCLSDKYINNDTKLRWKCAEGHIWEARPRLIKSKSWCPYCARRK